MIVIFFRSTIDKTNNSDTRNTINSTDESRDRLRPKILASVASSFYVKFKGIKTISLFKRKFL